MRRVFICGVVALLLAGCSEGDAEPEPSATDMPVARTEVSGVAWRDTIVVFGGLTADGTASARVDRYDARTQRWERLPDLPLALHHSAAVVLDDELHAVGGYTMDGPRWVERAEVFRLAYDADAWVPAASLPAARGAHAAAVLDDRIVVVGGVSNGAVTPSTAVFDTRTGWSSGPPLTQPREHLAAASANGRVYAIAGRVGATNFTTVEGWDGTAAAWTAAAPLRDSRGGIGAATLGTRPCVAGGEEVGGTIATIECFDGRRWTRSARLRVPRHGLAVAALNGRLHVIGGGGQPGLTVTTAHEVFSGL